tara:strand:- start:37 stop:696 length:660 start_codon:yes stop_codon:yes gene_type:complete
MSNNVFPVPMRTTSDNLDALITDQDRFKTNSSSSQEQMMAKGVYFTSSITGEGREIDGVPTYIVVNTGSLYHVLEELDIYVDYENSGDGNVSVLVEFYAMDSNKSDITVTGGTAVTLGVPVNLDFVNTLSTATFNFDATVTINSGDPDFILYSSQYYKDTAANRESLTGVASGFFDKNRKLIMPPNKQFVFRVTTDGAATGTLNSLSQFSFTEQENSNG